MKTHALFFAVFSLIGVLAAPAVAQSAFDMGDAPEDAPAYPWIAVMGSFPTCIQLGPSAFVRHNAMTPAPAYFGPGIDYENDGNADGCPLPPYDQDECQFDQDAGLMFPAAYTIIGGAPQTCGGAAPLPDLGQTCTLASWGSEIDMHITSTIDRVWVNVIVDWNQDGYWGGSSACLAGSADEHILQNLVVNGPYSGPLSALAPPNFLIGPYDGYVWARFSVSSSPLDQTGVLWDGSGPDLNPDFPHTWQFGETEDYLLKVIGEPTAAEPETWGKLKNRFSN